MSTLLRWNGTDYPVADLGSISPDEADKLERVVGMTLAKINRASQRCVCDHTATDHQHTDDDGNTTDDITCKACDCDTFEADMPAIVTTALMWLAIRRKDPQVTYRDIAGTAFDGFEFVEDPDPTGPPPEAA